MKPKVLPADPATYRTCPKISNIAARACINSCQPQASHKKGPLPCMEKQAYRQAYHQKDTPLSKPFKAATQSLQRRPLTREGHVPVTELTNVIADEKVGQSCLKLRSPRNRSQTRRIQGLPFAEDKVDVTRRCSQRTASTSRGNSARNSCSGSLEYRMQKHDSAVDFRRNRRFASHSLKQRRQILSAPDRTAAFIQALKISSSALSKAGDEKTKSEFFPEGALLENPSHGAELSLCKRA